MKAVFFILILLLQLQASEVLVFGTAATVETALMKKRLMPLVDYLQESIGRPIEFQSGYDYKDAIKKVSNGTFHLAYIGPAPYVLAKRLNPESIQILAGLKNSQEGCFHTVLIAKKGSHIVKLGDLENHSFAFGSPESTLSYYVPMEMLIKSGMIQKIKRYDFLGRHDKVAKYVIMNKYDAGAIKHSVAKKYSKHLQVLAQSKDMHDFMIVANANMDKKLLQKIQKALYELKNPEILKPIKESATGFEPREDGDYDEVRKIIDFVSVHK
ncbi:phosphate/phosphite/phosphonate ABC transporter substrate-binding protein [bacterium]|nr:phosphate/phosphite/phosphonate ABC transporter substrate-binding protein [bacterium]MBU1990401.1 phosphate/phosphite/phosphonate ABC transporter substrate-binding protein [bacterium]